jgi:putative transposase
MSQRTRRKIDASLKAKIAPRPRTAKPAPGHKIFPYLLRGLSIERPNQVWSADITYIPFGREYLYLVAIMNCSSQAARAWRLSNTMDVSFCVAALEEALAPKAASSPAPPSRGCLPLPEFASRWMDDGWTTCSSSGYGMNYEDIYLKGYVDDREARADIA